MHSCFVAHNEIGSWSCKHLGWNLQPFRCYNNVCDHSFEMSLKWISLHSCCLVWTLVHTAKLQRRMEYGDAGFCEIAEHACQDWQMDKNCKCVAVH